MTTSLSTPNSPIDTPLMSPSSTRVALRAAREAFALFLPVFMARGVWFLLLQIIDSGFDLYVNTVTAFLRDQGREDFFLLAVTTGAQALFTFIWSCFWIVSVVTIAQRVSHQKREIAESTPTFAHSMIQNLNQLMIESVRAFSAVLIRVPFLIVPALIEYLRLTFVPFIVMLDPDYVKGRTDALKRSRKLSQKMWILLAVFQILNLAITLALDFDPAPGDWSAAALLKFALVGVPLKTLVGTLLTLLLYSIFSQAFDSRVGTILSPPTTPDSARS